MQLIFIYDLGVAEPTKPSETSEAEKAEAKSKAEKEEKKAQKAEAEKGGKKKPHWFEEDLVCSFNFFTCVVRGFVC